MPIRNQEALEERANNLGSRNLNGIRLVLVDLQPQPDPTQAVLTAQFFNASGLGDIVDAIASDPSLAKVIFPIRGGRRLHGGPLAGQVQVVAVEPDPADATLLRLTVVPIGNYSTYTLGVVFGEAEPVIDPIFSEIEFKFRPGCFNNCPPEWPVPPAPRVDPPIDYLAKDYDSFRHTLIAWMMSRVPNWQPTSEADLDMVLLELFSATADELSDYQDRVMNEAYLTTARKRVSLARHARLMDYHIHQGNQASTWLAMRVAQGLLIGDEFIAWAGGEKPYYPGSVVFMARNPEDQDPPNSNSQTLDPLLNDLSLYTWSGTIHALAAGSTQADLQPSLSGIPGGMAQAQAIESMVQTGIVRYLLLQEHLNPRTGEQRGRNPQKRQLLRLLPGAAGATAGVDPLTGEWFVRIRWEERDQLRHNYCFTVDCAGVKVPNVSLFHGNLIEVFQGMPMEVTFREPQTELAILNEYHYERDQDGVVTCALPGGVLAYRQTPSGGEVPPRSTLSLEVEMNGVVDPWDEVISFVHSDDTAERGDHFIVETDEMGRSWVRTGNGTHGRQIPDGAIVRCRYQVGSGPDGNVGTDSITRFDSAAFPQVEEVWNPFDVTTGRAPEPVAEIVRRVPEAYRYRQPRAVTLKDYVDRAQEVPGVSRAAARYMWTGSWRTVRITIDPAGTTTLADDLRVRVSEHLEAVRLIGEDLEIRPPIFVPLDILVTLCIHPSYWPQDVRAWLEMEFSDGYTSDGRQAFFHPDRWTFGQTLHASQIIGTAQAVTGVDHVVSVILKRWNQPTSGAAGRLEVRPNEIIQVQNDPDYMELGSITFNVEGGRE